MSAPDAPFDRAALEALALVEDPLGVISIYVDADPTRQATARAPWAIEVDDRLAQIGRGLRDGPRERRVAFEQCLHDLAGSIATLVDPGEPGRGRALFATLSERRARAVTLQVPLATEVVLEPRAYVSPLVGALDRWRPMGVAAVSAGGLTLHELHLGAAGEVGRWEFDDATQDLREMKGPAAANPARGQQTAPQRDRFERRLDARRDRALAATAEAVGEAAAARGWDQIVLAGDPRVTQRVAESLPAASPTVLTIDRIIDGVAPHEIAGALAEELAARETERRGELVRRAREGAHAGGRGALGLDDTRAALEEGRVERLLLADDATLDGPGREPNVAERLTERALATGAGVTPVGPCAAVGLEPHDGVAAILRW